MATRSAGTAGSGLSPPTRGSPLRDPRLAAEIRSIPAHAGKPPDLEDHVWEQWVYPRPRGEAFGPATGHDADSGLSPPTRGSPGGRAGCASSFGSIPAHAGKPTRRTRVLPSTRVYPRPRGEALAGRPIRLNVPGLSPPTRGSPGEDLLHSRVLGSIPAHAGKPTCTAGSLSRRQVYPRPRGEASGPVIVQSWERGLSPPTRGSLLCSAAIRVYALGFNAVLRV